MKKKTKAKKTTSEHVMVRLPPKLKVQLEELARELGFGGAKNSGVSTLIRIILMESVPLYLKGKVS